MSDERRPRRRWAVATLMLLVCILGYACTDRISAPTIGAGDDLTLSGIVTGSLWRVRGDEVEYAGAVSGSVTITKNREGARVEVGAASLVPLRPAVRLEDHASLRSPVPLLALDNVSTSRPSAAKSGGMVRYSSIIPKRTTFKTKDGRAFTIRYVEDPRGGDRPPMAAMMYDGSRLISVNEYAYVRQGSRWRPSTSRITIYDSAGHPALVAAHDFGGVRTTSASRGRIDEQASNAMRQLGATVTRLVQPDALYAAECVDESAPCWREAIIVAGAEAAWAAGVIAVVAAYASCPATAGVTCAVGAAAQLALVGLDLALGVAWGDYLNCKRQSGYNAASRSGTPSEARLGPGSKSVDCVPIGDAGSGYGGNGGDSGGGCYSEVWEISYDGGETWQYYTTIWVCPFMT